MPRILERLKIREVSAVDRGAGEGVKVMLMKRDIPDTVTADALYDFAKADALPAEAQDYLKRTFSAKERRDAAASGAAMSDGSYPIENASDLSNAVRAVGRGKNNSHAAIRRHIISRARALGLTDKLPEDWKVKKGLVRKLLEAVGIAKATDFDTAQADVETGEYAQAMLCEFKEAIEALNQSICSIMNDPACTDKQAAVEATINQFQEHIQGVVPEGIENAMRGAALAAAGYQIDDQGAISKKDTPMTPEEKKALDDANKKAEDTNKALELAKREIAVLKMSQKHKDYVAARGDTMSQDEKDKFADMEPGERDAHMAKHPIPEDTEKRFNEAVAKAIANDPSVVALRKQNADLIEKAEVADLRKAWGEQGLLGPQIDSLLKARTGGVAKGALDELAKQFAATNAQAREAGLFNELGKSGGDGGGASAHDEIMAKAHELRKADPTLTLEQAYAKAYQDPANAAIAKRDRIENRPRAA